MEALAVGLEVALVVARGRDRHVFERQQRRHLAGPPRIADTNGPRAAAAIADHAAVTAGADDRVADAALAQDRRGVIDRVAFREAAEVDAHACTLEAQCARGAVEQEPAMADERARMRQRFFARAYALAVVIQMADRGVGDVERAVRELGERL